MDGEAERMQILEMIDSGKISVEDGLRLLESLEVDEAQPDGFLPEASTNEVRGGLKPEGYPEPDFPAPGASIPVQEPLVEGATTRSDPDGEALPDLEKFQRFWVIPFVAGIGVTLLGGLLMSAVIQAAGIFVGLICAGAPFFFGLGVIILALFSRTAHWMHLRVQQKPGEWPQRIAISLPIPIRLSSWFLRTFRHKIPQLEHTALDEILLALGTTTSSKNPLYLQVDEGEDGEKVQIFIG